MSDIQILHTVKELRAAVASYRADGKKIGLAPTMGNLHQGHISLTHTLRDHVDVVCATIFVNPKQFGENEDFGSYPRTFESDKALLEGAGVEMVFVPTVKEMYPDGFATNVHVSNVTQGLCDNNRPGHFDGVCTVVTKLLLQALPDVACFGEKDFQQLSVIKRFSKDLDIPVEIIGSPTLREEDGLAMSSRNNYLSAEERAIAPNLNRTMQEVVAKVINGENYAETLEAAKQQLLDNGFAKVDYLEIREEDDLVPVDQKTNKPQRLFAAAHLGKARLIDNVPVI